MNHPSHRTLGDIAKLIRSKNAGPWTLTIDVMLQDHDDYQAVIASKVLDASNVARLLGIDPTTIDVYHYAPANAIKLSFPRAVPNGHPEDTDVFGGQQFAPLVNLEIPVLSLSNTAN